MPVNKSKSEFIEIPLNLTGKDICSYAPLADLVYVVKNKKMRPVVRVFVTMKNYKNLSDITLFIKKSGASEICFAQLMLTENLAEHYHLLVPTQESLPELLKAIKVAQVEQMPYFIENLPLCLLPGEEEHALLSGNPGIKMQFCLDCELSPRCGGIRKAQLIAEYRTQLLSWQFLFPNNFLSEQDIAFLDAELLRSANGG